MIDHVWNPETIDYDEMNWAGLAAWMTGKILAEMDAVATDIATVNKLKHLNRLANYGMKTPMKSILNFNAVLFRAIENRSLSWDNWDKIELFHTRHLSSLTVAAAAISATGKTEVGQGNLGNQTVVAGKKVNQKALREAMVSHHMCFMFNRGL